jgi:hypothetical protein
MKIEVKKSTSRDIALDKMREAARNAYENGGITVDKATAVSRKKDDAAVRKNPNEKRRYSK